MYKLVISFYDKEDDYFEYVGKKTVEVESIKEAKDQEKAILDEFGCWYYESKLFNDKGELINDF